LRLKLKQVFDSSGAVIPSPHRVIYLRSDSRIDNQPKP
jgi:hypothetical protein